MIKNKISMMRIDSNGNHVIHEFNNVLNAKVSKSIDSVDTLTFTLASDNSVDISKLYSWLNNYVFDITASRDYGEIEDFYLFGGRVVSLTSDFYGNVSVSCKDFNLCLDTAVLINPLSFESETAIDVIESIFDSYNSVYGDSMNRIALDGADEEFGDATISIECDSGSTYSDALESVVSQIGGYIRIDGVLDFKTAYWGTEYSDMSGDYEEHIIEVNRNILDLTTAIDSSEVYSAVFPLGKDNGFGRRRISGNYIYDASARAKYGLRIKYLDLPDVNEPIELLKASQTELNNCKSPKISYEVKAVDFKFLDQARKFMNCGELITLKGDSSGRPVLAERVQIRSITYDLLNPFNDSYRLGDKITPVKLSTFSNNTMKLSDRIKIAVNNKTNVKQFNI